MILSRHAIYCAFNKYSVSRWELIAMQTRCFLFWSLWCCVHALSDSCPLLGKAIVLANICLQNTPQHNLLFHSLSLFLSRTPIPPQADFPAKLSLNTLSCLQVILLFLQVYRGLPSARPIQRLLLLLYDCYCYVIPYSYCQ